MNQIKVCIFVSIAFLVLFGIFFYPAGLFGPAIKHIDVEENVVFLSFDDGPSENTLHVLDILDEYGVLATFFVVGNQVKEHGEILNRTNELGNSIGIHSMSHPYLYRNITLEVVDSKLLVENVLGKEVVLFRPPYGFSNPKVCSINKENGLNIILWDVFPRDYKVSSKRIIKQVLRKSKPGSIIVMHDGCEDKSEMIEALPQIIVGLKEKGYIFGLIEDYV